VAHRPAKHLRAHLKRARRNPKGVEGDDGLGNAYNAARGVLGIATLITAPVAAAVSYKRNQSIGWAFLSGIVSIPYLIYVGISGPKS